MQVRQSVRQRCRQPQPPVTGQVVVTMTNMVGRPCSTALRRWECITLPYTEEHHTHPLHFQVPGYGSSRLVPYAVPSFVKGRYKGESADTKRHTRQSHGMREKPLHTQPNEREQGVSPLEIPRRNLLAIHTHTQSPRSTLPRLLRVVSPAHTKHPSPHRTLASCQAVWRSGCLCGSGAVPWEAAPAAHVVRLREWSDWAAPRRGALEAA